MFCALDVQQSGYQPFVQADICRQGLGKIGQTAGQCRCLRRADLQFIDDLQVGLGDFGIGDFIEKFLALGMQREENRCGNEQEQNQKNQW